MIDRENLDGNSDGGYNKLISQEDVTRDEQALHSVQEKQQGRNPTIGITTSLPFDSIILLSLFSLTGLLCLSCHSNTDFPVTFFFFLQFHCL